ncbi:YagK/YfjJ domain-containing protein [Budvicia aquatica]|uniref:YagK/YfjJ domain-containing protein n=1 Tax=Budvicia aquatica TaxID=82979 RepID=UPI0034CE1CAE
MKKANESHPRTLAIRIDLRLPDDDDGIAKIDPLCITRCMESLDEHLKADQERKKKAGKRVHPCTLRYVWVSGVYSKG